MLSSLIWIILQGFITLVVVVIIFYKWSFHYWVKRDVVVFSPVIPFGNVPFPFTSTTVHLGIRIKQLYDTLRTKGLKYGGLYFLTTPFLLIADLDLLKNILIKDFQYFTDRGAYLNERDDPITGNLFVIGGAKWHNIRTKMSPSFTTAKLRTMFKTLTDCEEGLLSTMLKCYDSKEPIHIKDVLGRFTTDVIGSCGFGLECKSFEDPNSPFRINGRKVFENSVLTRLKLLFGVSYPSVARALHIKPNKKEVTEFFIKIVKDTVDYREKNNISRNDFLQSMIELKNNKANADRMTLTIEEIAAQCFVFFAAGFETSATTMAFALYELAKNKDFQQKARNEVIAVLGRHENKFTYDCINDMKYISQIINETLRKYPPLSAITREAVKDYKIPGENLIIEKGVKVLIPVYGIHSNPEYYENPEIFDPERFSEENERTRKPFTYMPFGEGPRNCIGLRFGIMESKLGVASLLKNYEFTVNDKTQEPLKMTKYSFIFGAEGEIWLDAKKIDS